MFFSEHSVYNTNGLVILEMHEQRLSNDTKTMSLQTWRTTTRNEASCHRKNASHNYTLWRCVWKMTGKMRDEGLQCQIVLTSHWPIFANPRRHTSLRAVAYLCVSVSPLKHVTYYWRVCDQSKTRGSAVAKDRTSAADYTGGHWTRAYARVLRPFVVCLSSVTCIVYYRKTVWRSK